MAPLLDVRGLRVELATAGGWVRPVDEASFEVVGGSAAGLVGESGSGKTMLALGLVGLGPAGSRRSGEARLAWRDGEGWSDLVGMGERGLEAVRGREIGMVFQEPMTALNPVMRVGAQVSEALRMHERGLGRAELRRRTLGALERAAVPDPPLRARQYPHQLSGGLRQRAMIAMALAAGPRLLIADEPTTALDVTVQKQIVELLGRLQRESDLALLFISHDLALVAQAADRLLVMYAGRIVERGPTREVLERPAHPYTEALLRAAPGKGQKPVAIPGSVPRLEALPAGCAFEPRCAYRKAECRHEPPAERQAGREHFARCILAP